MDLMLKILSIRERFYKSMVGYTILFDKDKDARVTMFSKCINVLDSTFLGFYYYNFYLTNADWWKEIPSNLPVSLPEDDAISNHVDTFAMFIKIGFIQLLHSSIESSVRPVIETYNYKEYNKRISSFNRMYIWFFGEIDLLAHKPILDMLSTIRDVGHDNGVYYGNNKEIPLNGSIFKFESGKPVDFLKWDLLLDILLNIRNMLIGIVEATKSISVGIIDHSVS